MTRLSPGTVQDAFLAACRDELVALKPGNVHVHAAGHDMTVAHFERAAEAAAPFITDPELQVGTRIRRAVQASLVAAGCNTNLGILLLSAPLAAAASRTFSGDAESAPAARLRANLAATLDALDIDDAAEVFAAIAQAKPAGLGTVEEEDVARPPTVTLKQAMALAADRDRIAQAYVTDFEDVFDLGLPALAAARSHAPAPDLAVTTLHMTFLAAFDDSHIARKHGLAAAAEVREAALARRKLWHPAVSPDSFARLAAFDSLLKDQGLNPGTTADLVVGTLFSERLIALIQAQSSA